MQIYRYIADSSFRVRFSWLFKLDYLIMIMFAFATAFCHGAGVMRVFGIVFAVTAVILQLNDRMSVRRIKVPIELKMYLAWVVWSFASGLIVAEFPGVVVYNSTLGIQMSILSFAAYAIFMNQRQVLPFLAAVIIIALANVAAVKLGYHFNVHDTEIVKEAVDMGESRIVGLSGNANGLGFIMLNGIWAVILLYRIMDRCVPVVSRLLSIGLLALFSYYALNTASRKSLLVLCVMLCLWFVWMLPKRNSGYGVFFRLLALIIIPLIILPLTAYIMSDTLIGHRFQLLLDAGGGSAIEGYKANVRYALVMDGIEYWLRNPIAGIGIGNFSMIHWSGLYSHSDFIEPLACTGLIGFILYQGFAFSILARLLKLLKRRLPEDVEYVLKGMVLFIVACHYLIGLGCPHWSAQTHMLIMVFIGTYSWRVYREYVLGMKPIGR